MTPRAARPRPRGSRPADVATWAPTAFTGSSPIPTNPNVIEVRKGNGSNGWNAQPGEFNLSFSGEYGTQWRYRGRAPQKIGGTGFVAEGFDISSYYRRKPDSHDPRVAFIFEGIADEILGDFGLVGGGAAGLELDIYDELLGTPLHALLLASSDKHTAVYLEVLEELFFNVPGADSEAIEAPNRSCAIAVSNMPGKRGKPAQRYIRRRARALIGHEAR